MKNTSKIVFKKTELSSSTMSQINMLCNVLEQFRTSDPAGIIETSAMTLLRSVIQKEHETLVLD